MRLKFSSTICIDGTNFDFSRKGGGSIESPFTDYSTKPHELISQLSWYPSVLLVKSYKRGNGRPISNFHCSFGNCNFEGVKYSLSPCEPNQCSPLHPGLLVSSSCVRPRDWHPQLQSVCLSQRVFGFCSENGNNSLNFAMEQGMAGILERTLVGELVADKGLLISVSETVTVQQLLKVLSDNNITAVPVAGNVRNQAGSGGNAFAPRNTLYIGLVSMLDIVLHLAENLDSPEVALEISVARIIGQTLESRALWTINPSAKLQDALGYLCKGVHRFLVPTLEPEIRHGAEANGNTTLLRLLTQTDVVRFFLRNLQELGPSVSRTVEELGLLNPDLLAFAVPSDMTLVNALRLMRQMVGSTSVAVVEPREGGDYSEAHPRWVRGGKLVGTLSVSDFRKIDLEALRSLVDMTVADFLLTVSGNGVPFPIITCHPTTPLSTVMAVATDNRVHRVWVTDEDGWLVGVVSYSDIIGAVRREPGSFIAS